MRQAFLQKSALISLQWFFSLWLCAFTSQAQAADAAQLDFKRGIAEFRAKRLDNARLLFLRAEQAGLDSARLHYNLGVVYYRQANYGRAIEYFQRAAEFPETRQIAYYNLARCAQAQDGLKQAQLWYQQARNGRDPRIADLARRAEARLNNLLQLEWQIVAQTGVGFDSAVVGLTDQVTAQPTRTADVYQETQIAVSYGGLPVSEGRLAAHLNLYQLGYETVDEADIQSLATGLQWKRDYGDWARLGWRLNMAHEWLSSDPYQLRAALGGRWEHNWRQLWLKYALDAEWYEPQEARLRGISGSRFDLSATALGRVWGGVGMLQLFGQLNQRRDEINSPRRTGGRLLWRSPASGIWSLRPSLQWRVSTYEDGALPRERRLRARLRLASALSAEWQSLIDVEYERNRSLRESRRYEHSRLMLGLQWTPL